MQNLLEQMKKVMDYIIIDTAPSGITRDAQVLSGFVDAALIVVKQEKAKIPELLFNDSHINLMAKGYYKDENFSRNEEGRINLWDVYNLFTQANKSSYIDSFLDRNLNAFDFTKGIQKTLNGNSGYHWFLS